MNPLDRWRGEFIANSTAASARTGPKLAPLGNGGLQSCDANGNRAGGECW
jgi:hypothetical protein